MRYWILSGLMLTYAASAANEGGGPITAQTSHRIPPTASASVTQAKTTNILEKSANAVALAELPPLATGVTELKFSEFYRQPTGPRGLEFTDKLRSLDGKRVRILGYMVKQEKPVAHCFLLTPVPVRLNEEEYGFCEDMPSAVLHVFTDSSAPATVPLTPGLLLLTGTLSIGNHMEADGRISSVRLQLDPPTNEQRQTLSELVIPPVQKTISATNAVSVSKIHR